MADPLEPSWDGRAGAGGQIGDGGCEVAGGWRVREFVLGQADAIMLILAQARARGLAEGEARLHDRVAGAGSSFCLDFWIRDCCVSPEPAREGGHRADVKTSASGARKAEYLVEQRRETLARGTFKPEAFPELESVGGLDASPGGDRLA
jgi:hypothetical protein